MPEERNVKDQDDIPWYIDQGYDTGEGSKVTEEDDSGSDSSSSDSSGSSGSTVVVPDDAATRDRLKEETGTVAAGTGDTVEEAQEDAAENQSFDADPGTDVGEVERKQDLNQPLKNPQGSTPEEVQQAAEKIAGSDRFMGERTGRQAGLLASAIQRGQDEFDSLDIKTDQGQIQVIGRRQKEQRRQRNQDRTTRTVNPWQRNEKLTEFGTLIDPTRGNPNATLAEEFTTAGVDLMQTGQKFGEQTAAKIPETALREASTRTTSQQFLGIPNLATKTAQAGTVVEGFVDAAENRDITDEVGEFIEITKPGSSQEERKSAENLASGILTGGTAVTGLGISSIGAIPRASATTTQDALGIKEENREIAQSSDTGLEGTAEGFIVTGEQAAENPDKFIGQEIGEEIGEAVVFGTLTGGAGLAASAVPTPEFEVEPSLDTSKGQTRGIPGVPSDRGPATTPGPGTSPGPDFEPEPETEPETETEKLVETDIQSEFFGNSRTTAPSLEDNISVPGANSRPQSDALSRPESDIIGQTEVQTETRSEPDITTEIISEATTETEIRPEPDIVSEPEPEIENRPGGREFTEDNEEDSQGFLDSLFGDQQEFEPTRSVGADLLNIETDEEITQEEAGNPFNLRTGNL